MKRWPHLALLFALMALALLAWPAYLERAELQLWLLGPAWCG